MPYSPLGCCNEVVKFVSKSFEEVAGSCDNKVEILEYVAVHIGVGDIAFKLGKHRHHDDDDDDCDSVERLIHVVVL